MTSAARDIAKCFVRSDVQSILKSLTGFNLDKIYKATFNRELLNSRMELLSNEQLQKVCSGAVKCRDWLFCSFCVMIYL